MKFEDKNQKIGLAAKEIVKIDIRRFIGWVRWFMNE